MTPLARYLLKQTFLPQRKRKENEIWIEPKNVDKLRDALFDVHCFEVTKVLPLIFDVHDRMRSAFGGDESAANEDKWNSAFSKLAFLPAPKTWIEMRHPSGNRLGFLVAETKLDWANVNCFWRAGAEYLGMLSNKSSDYYDHGGTRYFPTWLELSDNLVPVLLSQLHFLLIIINSPRIIGRRQFMPNAGLERRATASFGSGKFPLHAWTEIELKVAKPPEVDDGEPHEAHLTGRRALHFCRKHIRVRLGRLEYVSAHWRGDPALGIKRSRYSVQP